jgi:hypothetical membrane protein
MDPTPPARRRPARPRVWIALALAGPWVYVGAVILGGALWSGYSHYAETISTLTSVGAPNQWLLQPLFLVYNLAVIALAVALDGAIRPTRYGRLGPAFLAAAGVAGIALAAFPQGPWSAPLSGTGVEHTIVAGIDALCFLLALGFLASRGSADPAWHPEGRLTAFFLIAGIVFGGFGAASVTQPYAGLAERLSIGTFLVWSELMALRLARRERPSAAYRPTAAGAPGGTD